MTNKFRKDSILVYILGFLPRFSLELERKKLLMSNELGLCASVVLCLFCDRGVLSIVEFCLNSLTMNPGSILMAHVLGMVHIRHLCGS